jgi:hypothetical protein
MEAVEAEQLRFLRPQRFDPLLVNTGLGKGVGYAHPAL